MNRLINAYLKKTNRPLSNYRVFKRADHISKYAHLFIGLFFIILVYFLLETFQVMETEILQPYPQYVALVSLPLLAGPLLYFHTKTTHRVLVTTDAFARQTFFRRYRLYLFNEVEKVRLTKKNKLKIRTRKDSLTIPLKRYEADLEKLKTIFDYEGHFKKRKRPYKVFIEGDELDVQELAPEYNKTTLRLMDSFSDNFDHLTPGYLGDISLYNTTINRVRFLENKHAVFELSHIDLKKDHPENTSFHAKQTDEAVMVFQDVSHVEIFNLDKDRARDVELLGTDLETLKKVVRRADVFEANIKPLEERLSVDLVLSRGVRRQLLRFTFKDAMVGFNKLVKDAWFEESL